MTPPPLLRGWLRALCALITFMTILALISFGARSLHEFYQLAQKQLDQMHLQISDLSYHTMTYNTQILSSQGQLMAELGTPRRRYTPLHTLNPETLRAFIAIEDADFFKHQGISFKAILRALLVNLKSGTFKQGGSTITQQTARSFFLSRKKLLSRKFKEIIMAKVLETKFSKQEILEIYLNQMYFGLGAYGIGAAAQAYFKKSAQSLTLPESAYLAALLKAPSRLSRHPPIGSETSKAGANENEANRLYRSNHLHGGQESAPRSSHGSSAKNKNSSLFCRRCSL